MRREPGRMSDSSSGLQGNQRLSRILMKYNVYRSIGIGIKNEEAKESGNGVDIFLCSCAAIMLAAWNMKKSVKIV